MSEASAEKVNTRVVTAHPSRERVLDNITLQLTALKERDVPRRIIDCFKDVKDDIIRHVCETRMTENAIPCILVIPESYLGLDGLLNLLRHGRAKGRTHLEPRHILNASRNTPQNPYFLINVTTNLNFLGTNPFTVQRAVNRDNNQRSMLTFAETCALELHTSLTDTYDISMIGSRYKEKNNTALLQLHRDKNNQIKLTASSTLTKDLISPTYKKRQALTV
jgi:hypothetical protein